MLPTGERAASHGAAGPCGHCPMGSAGAGGESALPCGMPEGPAPDGAPRVLLVGNPNVGKSVIFWLLTGRYVVASNYPGTTVSFDRGTMVLPDGSRAVLIDTPGVNSLIPTSEDERVTRDLVLEKGVHSVIQVVDSKNLRRGLLLSLELGDLGVPYVLVLNMEDEALSRGIVVDPERLSREIGVEVVPMVAVERKGLGKLRSSLASARPGLCPDPAEDRIERAVVETAQCLPDGEGRPRKALARMILSGEGEIPRVLDGRIPLETLERIEGMRRDLQGCFGEPLAFIQNRARLRQADRILDAVSRREARPARFSLATRLGDIAVHPFWGVPVLLAILWLMYEFVGVFAAGTLVDLIENGVFGARLNPVVIRLADAALPFPHTHLVEEGHIVPDYEVGAASLAAGGMALRFLHDLVVGPYGAFTVAVTYSVAIILPIVACFFLAFGVLEDTGYLPRLATMVNRIFRLMGLSGKAVLPMVLGLGCDTMATLTTRILENKKERVLVTLLLALGVPCSAQLGVILGMLGALSWKAVLVWGGSVVGIMLLVGAIGARVLPGHRSDFILEVPPIRLPKIDNLIIKTVGRVRWYLKEAVPLFILGTFILFALDRLQVLGTLEAAARPVVTGWLHLPQETAQAFLIGFLRRDYGAAGLFTLAEAGRLDPVQTVVSLVTMTLFIPCIANLMIMVKERGWKSAVGMTLFIFPFAFLAGGVLDRVLRWSGIML